MKIKRIMIQLFIPIFSCLNSTVLTFKKKPINKKYIYIYQKKENNLKNAFYIIDHLPKKKNQKLHFIS